MTTKERMKRITNHKEADRVPIIDTPWAGTVRRWENEGMPKGMDYRDYFDIDKAESVHINISPNYECKTLEETDRYRITTSPWGVTMKQFKEEDSSPEFLDFKVKDSTVWQEAKSRMTVDRSRIDWKMLKENYPRWEKEGVWTQAVFLFGFDVAHSWMSGTETILIAMLEEPEWVKDIIDTFLNQSLAHFQMIMDEGYRFDAMTWCDDMGYKNTSFFSLDLYRKILKPFHKKAIDFSHEKGMKVRLHSCGYIEPLLNDILETGIDILNPIEIKAGMDVLGLKKKYGDKLTLHGGINALLWDNKEEVITEINRILPTLMKDGGYIFASDHSIPNNVTLENFREIVNTLKTVGRY